LNIYVDSEWGFLRDVLICPVSSLPGANELWQREGLLDHAREQHAELVRILKMQDIRCHILASSPELGYKCYVRDSVVATPWGLLVPRMGFHQRDPEPERVVKDVQLAGSKIWHRTTTGVIEGGDVLILRHGIVAIGWNGFRTDLAGAYQAMKWFDSAGWKCHLIHYSTTFMHLDVILGVINSNNLIYCPSAFMPHDREWLRSTGMALHPVNEAECREMACNIFSVDGRRIITCDRTGRSVDVLSRLGCSVIEINLEAFVRDGGGVHCLLQAIRRDPTPRLTRTLPEYTIAEEPTE
jgi:arginine deiminase